MKHRLFSLMLALAMVFCLTSCAGTEESNEKNKIAMTLVGVAVTGNRESNPYGVALEAQLKEVGYSVEVAYAEEGTQAKHIADMVEDGASVLVIQPEDSQTVKKALESINVDVSNVHVIAVDGYVDSDTVDVYVGRDYEQLGREQAKFVAERLNLEGMDEEDEPVTVEMVADRSVDAEKAAAAAMSVLQEYVDGGKVKILSGKTTGAEIQVEDAGAWAKEMFSTTYAGQDMSAVLTFGFGQGEAVVDAVLNSYTGRVFPLIASAGDSAQGMEYLSHYYLGCMTVCEEEKIVEEAVQAVWGIVNAATEQNRYQTVESTLVTVKDYQKLMIDSGRYEVTENGGFRKK